MSKSPGNGDGQKIITMPTAQEHGLCHRSAGGQVLMAAPGGPAGLIGGAQPQPVNVGTWQPCVGKMCHFWDEAAEQCMDRTHVDLIADQVQLLTDAIPAFLTPTPSLGEIVRVLSEIRELLTPPIGERRPLPVTIIEPITFKKES